MAQQHSPNKAECRHAEGFEKVLVTAVAEDEDAWSDGITGKNS